MIILIGVALNLAPPDATSLTLQMQRGGIQLTKQASGEWNLSGSPLNFVADDSELSIKGSGNNQTIGFAKLAGIDTDADWSELKQITLRGTPAQIQRMANGLDVVLQAKLGDTRPPQTHMLRWRSSEEK
jgi:hypothetical protein